MGLAIATLLIVILCAMYAPAFGLLMILIGFMMCMSAYDKLKTSHTNETIDSFLTIKIIKYGYLWPEKFSKNGHYKSYLINVLMWGTMFFIGILFSFYGIEYIYQLLPRRILVSLFGLILCISGVIYLHKILKNSLKWRMISLLWIVFCYYIALNILWNIPH